MMYTLIPRLTLKTYFRLTHSSKCIIFKPSLSNLVCQSRHYTNRNILKLAERGIWENRFPPSCLEFEKNLDNPKHGFKVYSGFDPTASSLHIGNLLVIMALLHCQRAGYHVIALVGGATALIGDPSGKNSERPALEEAVVESNANNIKKTLMRIFKNHKELIWKDYGTKESLHPVRIVNNADWHKELSIMDILRKIGHSCRMGDLIKRSSIKSRIESHEGLSFTEFSYQVLQAYDWLYLYTKYGCTIQIGGNDQMGNIMTGYEILRKTGETMVTGLTVPIITNEQGRKFGKSEGSPIWIDPNKTSPFDFYQYLYRTHDANVETMLKLFTFLPLSDIDATMQSHRISPDKHIAQKKLAERATLLVHGDEGLQSAKRITELLYTDNSLIFRDITEDELISAFPECPSVTLTLEPGTTVLDMALKAECFTNSKIAMGVITDGGFYINKSRVTEPFLVLIPGAHVLNSGCSLLRVGKKNYCLVKWST